MQRIHVTMLLHNTLELADTWVNPFLRGHHISRHVLLCFPPLLVLLWAMDAQNRWVAWLCGAFLYASFPLSRTPLFRANTFSAHTHTYKSTECMHISAHTCRHGHTGWHVNTLTNQKMPHTQTPSHTHVAVVPSKVVLSKLMLSPCRKFWTLWTQMDNLEKQRRRGQIWGRIDAAPNLVTDVTACFSVRNTL